MEYSTVFSYMAYTGRMRTRQYWGVAHNALLLKAVYHTDRSRARARDMEQACCR